jgi:tRNA(Ile)-lysidine synthase
VLLAVSGGADSVALTLLMAKVAPRFSLRLEVATLDHGLRPEAAAECAHVMALAGSLGLSAHSRELRLTPGPGLEARARQARYEMLEHLRAARCLDLIATGHTATDQAESVLMRLGRGSALEGAAAIWGVRGRVVRPLLDITRDQVRAYLRERGASWAEDPMNEDPAYLRVRVREGLLPKLRELFGENVEQHFAQFADFAHEDAQALKHGADVAYTRLTIDPETLDAVGLKYLERPLARRVIARFLRERDVPIDAQVIEDCWAAVHEGRTATVGKDRLLNCQNGQVRLALAPPRK